jgi:hypothetical protein
MDKINKYDIDLTKLSGTFTNIVETDNSSIYVQTEKSCIGKKYLYKIDFNEGTTTYVVIHEWNNGSIMKLQSGIHYGSTLPILFWYLYNGEIIKIYQDTFTEKHKKYYNTSLEFLGSAIMLSSTEYNFNFLVNNNYMYISAHLPCQEQVDITKYKTIIINLDTNVMTSYENSYLNFDHYKGYIVLKGDKEDKLIKGVKVIATGDTIKKVKTSKKTYFEIKKGKLISIIEPTYVVQTRDLINNEDILIDINMETGFIRINYQENMFDVYESIIDVYDFSSDSCIQNLEMLYDILRDAVNKNDTTLTYKIIDEENIKYFVLKIKNRFFDEEQKFVLIELNDEITKLKSKVSYLMDKLIENRRNK